MGKFLSAVIALVVCFYAQGTSAQESAEQKMRRELEAAQSQLQQLQSQAGGLIPGLPATPEDKVKLVVDSINRSYTDLKQTIYSDVLPDTGVLIPIPYVSRLSGYIEVGGVDQEQSTRGWTPLDLKYTVREEFIGYLVTTRYYDTHTRKFRDQKDYQIASISTDIQVLSLSGRECVKRGTYGCDEWASFAKSEISRSNIYPAIHDWVILGDSENGVVSIKVESPNVYFSSLNKRAGQGLGCYGTTLQMSIEEFVKKLKAQSLSQTEPIGKAGAASHCDPGSTVDVHIDFCDKTKYADLNACRQVELLLGSMKQALALRDAYRRWGGEAEDTSQLDRLVTRDIVADYPLLDLQDDNFLENNSATYRCGAITIPDLCGRCVPKPLCQWEREALQAHEQNHDQLVAARSDYHTLFCGTTLDQVTLYPDANERARAEARALSNLEYSAYTEQARYLNDVIQQQLHGISDCSLSPTFMLDYTAIQQRLNAP